MIKVLFLCAQNACRSILAEAIARKLGNNRWQVASASSHPTGKVHPLTLKYLRGAGKADNTGDTSIFKNGCRG